MSGTALVIHPFNPVELGPLSPAPDAAFDVNVMGVSAGETVSLIFWEKDDPKLPNPRPDRQLGTAQGVAAPSKGHPGVMTVVLDGPPDPPPEAAPGQPKPILIAFRLPGSDSGNPTTICLFALSEDRAHEHEGDAWLISVDSDSLGLSSPAYALAHVRRELAQTDATYSPREGHALKMFHDGATDAIGSGGAFFEMLVALKQATKFVFIADWSFHPLFRPSRVGPGAVADPSNSIGALLLQNAAAGALVAIHTWDHTNIAAPDPQNDSGNDVFKSLNGGKRPANVLWRASSHDNTGMSHHQKFVVMDQPDPSGRLSLRVFFGGLDLTKGRFDHPGHPILPTDTANTWPYLQQWHTMDYAPPFVTQTDDGSDIAVPGSGTATDEWYSAEFKDRRDLPREPWHDIYGTVKGPVAWDFVREFVGRWTEDPTWTPTQGDNDKPAIQRVQDVFRGLFDSTKFVQQWESHDGPFAAQLYRSIIKSHWGGELSVAEGEARKQGRKKELHWSLPQDYEQSIQRAYRQAIQQADDFIYIENQYFMGSGPRWGDSKLANDIPEQLVNRIKQRRADGGDFHVYIVMPMYPEGSPADSAIMEQRSNEQRTMQWMIEQLGENWTDSLSFYFLANWTDLPTRPTPASTSREDLVRAHQRYMIYVHSKLMIVDDRYVIFGSANLNDRSLAGDHDTEIAAGFWPMRGKSDECIDIVRRFRLDLWKEHLNTDVSGFGQNPGSLDCSSELRKRALKNYQDYFTMRRTADSGHLCRLSLKVKGGQLTVDDSTLPDGANAKLLPDAPGDTNDKSVTKAWSWSSAGSKLMQTLGVAR